MPPLSFTLAARASISLAPRNDAQLVAQPLHRRTGDRDRTLQGVDRLVRAHLVADSAEQPVLSNPFLLRTRSVPVFSSMKLPVPYVFFASPGAKQPCPNTAACWSPRMPVSGTPANPAGAATSPY